MSAATFVRVLGSYGHDEEYTGDEYYASESKNLFIMTQVGGFFDFEEGSFKDCLELGFLEDPLKVGSFEDSCEVGSFEDLLTGRSLANPSEVGTFEDPLEMGFFDDPLNGRSLEGE